MSITFKGESGSTYECVIYPINHSTTPSKAGIYIFGKSLNNQWHSLYIGQTHDFYNRIFLYLEDHDAWDCLQRNKATHVALYEFSGTEQQRIRIETDLRHNYSTACNQQ
jgi:predicted GIY-YIG superfamily endonuclease